MKNRRMKLLNDLTLGMQGSPVWMIEEQAAASIHSTMLAMWSERDLPEDPFAATPGMRLAKLLARTMGGSGEPSQDIFGGVGVVFVSGMIRQKEDIWTEWGYGTAGSTVASKVESFLSKSDVHAVLLVVDSPGGQAAGNEEAARRIRAASEQSGKPVWTVAHGTMASAAYYLGAAANRVLATDGTSAGSVGALMIHAQWRPEDVTFNVIRFGEMKATPNQYEALGDAGKAEMQRIVDQCGSQFLATVAEFRGVSLSDARTKFGQGRMFYQSSDLLERNMIDGQVRSVQAALSQLQKHVMQNNGGSVQARLEASCQTNHESGTLAAVSATQTEGDRMNPKIKAALYARGLIASLDASNDVAEAALTAFFAGRGCERPKTDDETLAALNGNVKAVAAVAEPLKPNPVQAAHDSEQAEARAEARRQEVARAKSIRERGALLKCSTEDIEAAVASGDDANTAVSKLVDKLAAQAKPVVTNPQETGSAAFAQDAIDALTLRCQGTAANASEQARRWARNGISLGALAGMSLELQGVRFDRFASGEDVAKLALTTGGTRSEILLDDGGGSVNRPSSFPNLLSNLANKLFIMGMDRAQPTYPTWTGRSPADLPDLKEGPLISRSQPYVMDEIIDDERREQLKLAEECLSLIRVKRYGNKFGWTPVMVANDDLGAFVEGMIGFGAAWENTVNLLCLGLLTNNVTLLDAYALFDDTNHGNNKTSSAGAPDTTQWKAMQDKLSAQRPVGGKGYVRQRLSVLLCPPQLEVASLQLLAAFGAIPEVKNPATDATINVYRGSGKVVVEPELQAASATVYYGLVDPMLAPTVVRVYQRGWSDGVRRTQWVDPETGTAWVGFEGRVGAAVKDYRTAVRNAGA